MNENNATNTSTEENLDAQPPRYIADKSNQNAMKFWGFFILILGSLVGFEITRRLSTEGGIAWVYGILVIIGAVTLGMLLLGISEIIDRLNTVIKLIKKSKQD